MKRKRSDAEKAFMEARTHATVVAKLATLYPHEELIDEIRRSCLVYKQWQLEALHVACLHVLRCIELGLDLPRLDDAFFEWCIRGVRNEGLQVRDRRARLPEAARQRAMSRPVDPALRETVRIYREARAGATNYTHPPQIQYCSEQISAMAKTMSTNVKVIVQEQFLERLVTEIRLQLIERTGEAPKSEVERLRFVCFGPGDGEYTDDEQELRQWLGFRPYKSEMKRNMAMSLVKLQEILALIETASRPSQEQDSDDGEVELEMEPKDDVSLPGEPEPDRAKSSDPKHLKGIRAFTILPVSTNFVPMHVVLNGSTLQEFCARLLYIRNGANPVGIPVGSRGGLVKPKVVAQQGEYYLRRAFAVNRFETSNRQFAKQVTTNGYSAAVLLTRPKTEEELEKERLEAEHEHEVDNRAKKRRKLRHTQGMRQPRRYQRALVSNNVWTAAWNILPSDYTADMLVAIDPGMRSLATAVSEGAPLKDVNLARQRRRRRRHRNRRHRARRTQIVRKWKRLSRRSRGRIRRAKRKAKRPPDQPQVRQVGNETVIAIRTHEYRHVAGFNKARFWVEGLKKRNPDYARAISTMPSFKTASYRTYLERLGQFWQRVNVLLAFTSQHGFLKWRLFQKRMKMKALDECAARFVPVPSPRVLVGYRNWSRQSGIPGHASGPVKAFRQALSRRATVVLIDEFRTSKLCSKCFQPLTEPYLPTRTKDSFETVVKRTRNVLCCFRSECEAFAWDRDVNAARNIMTLLKDKLYGVDGRAEFTRDRWTAIGIVGGESLHHTVPMTGRIQ